MAEPISGYNTAASSFSAAKNSASVSSSMKAGELAQPANTGGLLGYIMNGEQDKRAPEEKAENKKGPISGLLSGMGNGLKETLKGLFSIEGLAMVGGFLALNFMTGGAITPFLVAAGAGVGGVQTIKGLSKGDWEETGRGLFTLGTTVAGVKVDVKSLNHLKSGESFPMALSAAKKAGVQGASKTTPGILDNIRLVMGKKMTGMDGGQKSLYQLMSSNFKHRAGSFFDAKG